MADLNLQLGDTVHGPRATVVKLVAEVDGETIEVTGEALRHPDDKNDEQLAMLLANGRALEALGRKLQKRAQGLVRHNDYLAALKARHRKAKANRNKRRQAV